MFNYHLRFKTAAAIAVLFAAITSDAGKDIAWNRMTEKQRQAAPIEYKAHACGLTVEEFNFMSRVIEKESDRSADIEGRVYIAATIINRVNDERFPNSVEGVLTQAGQFSTVSNGWCDQPSTDLSDWAIVEAYRRLEAQEIPEDILFFNCIGYCHEPYALIGGNYFSIA